MYYLFIRVDKNLHGSSNTMHLNRRFMPAKEGKRVEKNCKFVNFELRISTTPRYTSRFLLVFKLVIGFFDFPPPIVNIRIPISNVFLLHSPPFGVLEQFVGEKKKTPFSINQFFSKKKNI